MGSYTSCSGPPWICLSATKLSPMYLGAGITSGNTTRFDMEGTKGNCCFLTVDGKMGTGKRWCTRVGSITATPGWDPNISCYIYSRIEGAGSGAGLGGRGFVLEGPAGVPLRSY